MRREMDLLCIAPCAILGMLLFVFIGGEVVQLLWNWLLPTLFGWRPITFWQALGLLALCRILFGGFGCARPWPLPHPPPHGRALGTHDARGAGPIPARDARPFRFRPTHERKQGLMS